MIEKRIIRCRLCGKDKEAFLDGLFNNGKDKAWRDENGRLFNGRKCPDCHANRMKEHMKKKRSGDDKN